MLSGRKRGGAPVVEATGKGVSVKKPAYDKVDWANDGVEEARLVKAVKDA